MFEKKVTLVTGASRGIGKGIAIELGNNGAIVIGTATTEQGAENISKYLSDAGITGKGMVLDVRNNKSIDECLAKIVDEYGNIEILVNNAGITRDTLLMRMKLDQWRIPCDTSIIHKGYAIDENEARSMGRSV